MPRLTRSEFKSFENTFDRSFEDKALQARGRFLRLFPLASLPRLRINKYVIGLGTDSFCALVEPQTAAWAKIQGATSFKFGIYYGRTKSDPARRYRSSEKFGDEAEAFGAVKLALLDLVRAGQAKQFVEVDANLHSQMFKAKILSLYFPEKYINVCSANHIKLFALKLGLPKNRPVSELQHLLLQQKLKNSITKKWSNPKFMRFLGTSDPKATLQIGIVAPP